jgi:hypothetical protein
MKARFAVCLNNEGFSASLERFKIYRVLPDERAAKHGLLRIVDESGEDYLYPADRFAPIEPPEAVERAFEASLASTS